MKFASAQPLTEAERQACAKRQRATTYKQFNRRRAVEKATFYAVPGTPESKRLSNRIAGETNED